MTTPIISGPGRKGGESLKTEGGRKAPGQRGSPAPAPEILLYKFSSPWCFSLDFQALGFPGCFFPPVVAITGYSDLDSFGRK